MKYYALINKNRDSDDQIDKQFIEEICYLKVIKVEKLK